MDKAPSLRSSDGAVMCSLSGHITARPADVFVALGRKLSLREGSTARFAADERAYFFVVQAGRWRRAEYRVIPDDHGSHVEHRLLNVAQRARPFDRARQQKVLASAPAEFEKLLRELRLELE